jgi:hypothetical protein
MISQRKNYQFDIFFKTLDDKKVSHPNDFDDSPASKPSNLRGMICTECQTLRIELAEERQRSDELQRKLELLPYQPQKRKSSSSKANHSHLQKTLEELRAETERMRAFYPLRDLLHAKQAEVDRMKKALQDVPADHPERSTIESMVKSHIVERDEIRNLIDEAEVRFQAQLQVIDETLQTLPSETSDHKEILPVPEF